MKKTIIGIVCKHHKEDIRKFRDIFVRDDLKQAIFDNGAVAVGVLPPCFRKVEAKDDWEDSFIEKEREAFTTQIELCDGIILQSGSFSDEYECYIAKYCFDNNIPILGINEGMLAIVRGVRGEIANIDIEDNPHVSDEKYAHEITIDKNSILYRILSKEKMKVNSRHTNFIQDVGVLQDVAHSDDGLIEAVEARSKRCYAGIQFNPEDMYMTDENMNKIFKGFINICKGD